MPTPFTGKINVVFVGANQAAINELVVFESPDSKPSLHGVQRTLSLQIKAQGGSIPAQGKLCFYTTYPYNILMDAGPLFRHTNIIALAIDLTSVISLKTVSNLYKSLKKQCESQCSDPYVITAVILNADAVNTASGSHQAELRSNLEKLFVLAKHSNIPCFSINTKPGAEVHAMIDGMAQALFAKSEHAPEDVLFEVKVAGQIPPPAPVPAKKQSFFGRLFTQEATAPAPEPIVMPKAVPAMCHYFSDLEEKYPELSHIDLMYDLSSVLTVAEYPEQGERPSDIALRRLMPS